MSKYEALRSTSVEFQFYWRKVLEPELQKTHNIRSWDNERVNATINNLYKQYLETVQARSEPKKAFWTETEYADLCLRDSPPTHSRVVEILKLKKQNRRIRGNERKHQDMSLLQKDPIFFPLFYSEEKPIFELFCADYVQELAKVISEQCLKYFLSLELQNKQPDFCFRVLEVGCGNGRLAFLLRQELTNLSQKENDGFHYSFTCCDTFEDTIPLVQQVAQNKCDPKQFSFLEMPFDKACAVVNPHLIISSWMPLGEDWSECFRKSSAVSYVLIGPKEATGNQHTWEKHEDWVQHNLPFSCLQFSRCDTSESYGNSQTFLFERTNEHSDIFNSFDMLSVAREHFLAGKLEQAFQLYFQTALSFQKKKTTILNKLCGKAFANASTCALKIGESSLKENSKESILWLHKCVICAEQAYNCTSCSLLRVLYSFIKATRLCVLFHRNNHSSSSTISSTVSLLGLPMGQFCELLKLVCEQKEQNQTIAEINSLIEGEKNKELSNEFDLLVKEIKV